MIMNEKDNRFVITLNRKYNSVSVLDTEEGNLEAFGLVLEDEESAFRMADELDTIVRLINNQDKELKKMGIKFP